MLVVLNFDDDVEVEVVNIETTLSNTQVLNFDLSNESFLLIP